MPATPTLVEGSASEYELFETQGRESGVLSDEGFFVQGDWEFDLDTLQDTSREALEAHLSRGPVNHETALYLKSYLMNSKSVHFTPFP
ncbi:hypothetical protein CBP36_19825 (plasmid) [Acidovorax carolinensis]|uniref:Uncharacterized protein n=1 Tax=Acidovorax carolinensis TaxID=553814 RepID=A0A240UI95_9BURK|nr:hypothetical protein [Acidovorax carolinensis]ART57158.1 hypothetical protein CBP35_19790 [Acidovorax carolinensis]ART61217.1 hypothetical protein CBP36_19825 [Acidovorax carolinensis]